MSTTRDPRIDAYNAKSATFAQPILKHLRELVHRAAPDASETLKWGMPFFQSSDALLCGMAAFKAHCTFGFWHQGMKAVLGRDGMNADNAMGSFGRIASLEDLPNDKTMLRYIAEAVKLNASGAPARQRTARGAAKELPVPAELAAALKRNKPAAKTFAAFSPSHRNAYVEWIVEAKRDETRQKRLATALEWLAEGKSRNWKYENC
jgi:uncharacterized protein YdeI (YjbR/CyaY-like superfamily)